MSALFQFDTAGSFFDKSNLPDDNDRKDTGIILLCFKNGVDYNKSARPGCCTPNRESGCRLT